MNSFGTQLNWPDGTECAEGTMSGIGRTFIRDLCDGMSNAVREQSDTSCRVEFLPAELCMTVNILLYDRILWE